MNSRLSHHGGWSAAGTQQQLADVLHAASRAPSTSGPLTIYAATSANVYRYDAANHELILHRAGDHRSDATAAFEVGVAAERTTDAGASMHLAQLEAAALWTGTAGQLASCPRASATTFANSNWSPTTPIDIVICYGIRSVPGRTSTLVAISSDGSLPDPVMDGPVYLDAALASLAVDSTFASRELSLAERSQILWAAYGCSNHTASGKAGLVCSSAVANYYLTRRIYLVTPQGVYRYHVRQPPGTDATTRDHRIELVQAGDAGPQLREGVAGLPSAPDYLVICVGTAGAWPELEVGFAAMGAALEATGLNLQAFINSGLTAEEQNAIRGATGIPPAEIPIGMVSLGEPGGTDGVVSDAATSGPTLCIAGGPVVSSSATIRYTVPRACLVDLGVFDCLGHVTRNLLAAQPAEGEATVRWDGRNESGQPVPSGVYLVRMRANGRTNTAQAIILR